MIYRLTCSIFLLIVAEKLFSQSNKDSLSQKSTSELLKLFENSQENLNKEYYIEAFIKKNKEKRDTLSVVERYNYLALMHKQDTLGLHYADSIIELTINNPIALYPANGFMLKGDQYFFVQGNLKKALDNYLLADDYSKKFFNKETTFGSNHMIGLIKDKIGYSQEALQIHIENLRLVEEKFDTPIKSIFSGTSLQAIAFTYKNLGKLDSALYYNNRGMKLAQRVNHISLINHLLLNEGVIYFHKSELKKSQISLKKSLKYFEKIQDKANMAEGYFYLAKTYDKQGDEKQSIEYLKKVDSIFIDTRNLSPDIRENYEMLIGYYKRKNEPTAQLIYLERLISLDSLLSSDKSYLSKHLKDRYDIPKLIKRKEVLISKLKKNHQYLKYVFFIIGITFIFIMVLLYNRQKKFKRKFQSIMNTNLASETNTLFAKESSSKDKKEDNQEIQKTEDNAKDIQSIGIPESIVKDILHKLEKFQEDKSFIDKKWTSVTMAKKFKTNTRYLSKVINTYKQKNFNTFLNDLRVDYVVEKLKVDSQFRLFSISAIAKEAGFNSSEVFSKYFHKKTGLYPSYFIKNINKQKFK